jgi:DNA-binding transcriptional MerR regulator/predicted transcriptional regulator YdeE
MNIGDFARLGPVSPRMLRHYDQLGLLQPEDVDSTTGYRSYSVRQLPRLHRILALRDLGIGLNEISTVLQDNPSVEELRGMLRLRRAQLEDTIAAERDQLARVEAHLRAIERNIEMPSTNVVIKKSQPIRIAEMFAVAPGAGPANIGPIFGALNPQIIERLGKAGLRPGMCVGYYDEAQDDGSIGVHVGFEIGDQEIDTDDTLKITELPVVDVASAVYEGPIDEISSWYEQLYSWVEDSGRDATGSARELYLEWHDDAPAKNVTEIQIPIS